MPERTRRDNRIRRPRTSPGLRATAGSPPTPGLRSNRPTHTTPGPAPTKPPSSQRILDAASAEFALRGFAAATVDRIAARAHLNKAMIYYHFRSKQNLYRLVLRDIFTAIADRLHAIAVSSDNPNDKIDRFVDVFVREGLTRPHLAPIVLREVAEGGRRLDEQTYTLMISVVRTMTGIIEEGRTAGQFADIDPILLYLTTVWPIMVYLATDPIRKSIARVARFDPARLDPDRFITHMQTLNRKALARYPGA